MISEHVKEHAILGIKPLTNPLQYQGNIAVNGDFPASPLNGWMYTVSASVTDPYHIGQSFVLGDEIVWNGTTWVLLGNTLNHLKVDQTTPQTITATDVTITASDEIYYGDVTDSTKLKKDTVQGILDLVPTPDLTTRVKVDQTTPDTMVGTFTFPIIRATTGIYDNAGTPLLSINAGTRKLYDSLGTTTMLDWSTAGTAQFGTQNIVTTGTLGAGAITGTSFTVGANTLDTEFAYLDGIAAYVYRSGGTDVAVADGGTNISSYAVGDLLYASGTATLSKLADVAAGSYLRSGGVTTAPLWSTLILPNAATQYRIALATAANTIGEDAGLTYNTSTDAFAVTGTISASTGFKINAGSAASGAFLIGNGTNFVASTLIMPNAATQYQLVLATATNTYGGDAGLTYNTSTDVLTVQKRITVSGGTVIADGLYSTGTFYVTGIKGLAGTGQGSTVYLYTGDGGDNPNPGLGGAGGTIYALSGSGGTGITTGGTGGEFYFAAGGGGTATAATGATGGAGGGFQLTSGGGSTATGCTSGAAAGGRGGDCSFASGSGGGTSTISGTATSTGGRGGNLSFSSGSGSQSNISGLSSNTGGGGGNCIFSSGSGGRGRFGVLNVGGDGGYLQFSAAQGGSTTATGGTTTSNTGGNGGKLDLLSGSGASVSGASVTNIGGNAGDITLSAGLGGTGATSNGANGHILFKSSTTEVGRFDNSAGSVGVFKTLSGRILKVTAVTDTYQVLTTDDVITCSKATNFTITLPVAVVGQRFIIKNIGVGIVTIDGNSTDTIDGDLTQQLLQWESAQLVCYVANKWGVI